MLHSKFSTSFDHDNQSVSIWITHKVNEEMTNLNLNFYFDESGSLEIKESSKRESFKYLARHVKTTMPKLREYLEDSYQDDFVQFAEGN